MVSGFMFWAVFVAKQSCASKVDSSDRFKSSTSPMPLKAHKLARDASGRDAKGAHVVDGHCWTGVGLGHGTL